MTYDPGRFAISKVREAAEAYARGLAGKASVWVAQDGVAKALGLPPYWRDGEPKYGSVSIRRLEGQMYRALDELAEPATDRLPALVKVGKDETGPDGRRTRMAMYWSPMEFRTVADLHAISEAGAIERNQRWTAVVARLAELGYQSDDKARPVLGVESWESLLGRIPAVEVLDTYERGQEH